MGLLYTSLLLGSKGQLGNVPKVVASVQKNRQKNIMFL
jgi:hypothetical protein